MPLRVADFVIVPLQSAQFSMDGVAIMIEFITGVPGEP